MTRKKAHTPIPNFDATNSVAATPRRRWVSATPRRDFPRTFSPGRFHQNASHWRRGVADTFCDGASQLRPTTFGVASVAGSHQRVPIVYFQNKAVSIVIKRRTL